jgi:SpoVK/Ycf46/Vps4 family AAA+-type ATPase
MTVLRRSKEGDDIVIKMNDFKEALKKVMPSVSKKDELKYLKMKAGLRNHRGAIE